MRPADHDRHAATPELPGERVGVKRGGRRGGDPHEIRRHGRSRTGSTISSVCVTIVLARRERRDQRHRELRKLNQAPPRSRRDSGDSAVIRWIRIGSGAGRVSAEMRLPQRALRNARSNPGSARTTVSRSTVSEMRMWPGMPKPEPGTVSTPSSASSRTKATSSSIGVRGNT